MFWLIILAIAIVGLTYAVFRFGLLEKFQMEQGRLLACTVIFLSYRGSYSTVGPLFEQVSKDTNSVFKLSQNFGFYFDNPDIVEPQNCRAIVGILVNEGQTFKVRQFLRKYPGYRQARLNSTKYLVHEMPYVNVLSIFLMVKSVYPKIHEYIKTKQIDENSVCGMMEIYRFIPSDKMIEICLPLENKEQFQNLYFESAKNFESEKKKQKFKELIKED